MTKKNFQTTIKKFLLTIVFIFIIIYLGLNIFWSQYISPIYEGVVVGRQEAVVSYLKNIMILPEFKTELISYKKQYGDSLENEVFQISRERKAKIGKLEELLTKNNQARDVLYELYILYKEDGNDGKAKEYLQRARKIDPTLK